MNNLFKLLFVFVCVACVFTQDVGSDIVWENINGGEWIEETNWEEQPFGVYREPRTIDAAFIELDTDVTVYLNETRVLVATEIENGNTLVINPDISLILAPGQECAEGNFVDPTDLVCKQCPDEEVQPLEDQSWCYDCTIEGFISSTDHTECVPCPAGTVYTNPDNVTVPIQDGVPFIPGGTCQNCPAYRESDGLGGPCTCCPAGTSSVSGGVCTACPAGTDSHICGPCLSCLPSLREESCPSTLNGVCNGEAACVDVLDGVLTLQGFPFQTCDCTDGPNCDFDNANYDSLQITSGSAYQLPFPFGTENLLKRALPVGVTVSFPNDPFPFANNPARATIRMVPVDSNYAAMGLPDPINNPPEGHTATLFGFEFLVEGLNNRFEQELQDPFYITVPYDELSNHINNPFDLQAFYYNDIEEKWIDTSYTCVANNADDKVVDDQAGTITLVSFQASAYFHIFIDNLVNYDDDTDNGVLSPLAPNADNGNNLGPGVNPTHNGNTRPPTPTTGISTGVTGSQAPAPVTVPNQGIVSPPIKNDPSDQNASNLINPNILLISLLMFVLFKYY